MATRIMLITLCPFVCLQDDNNKHTWKTNKNTKKNTTMFVLMVLALKVINSSV